jgi:hypothetical protein
MIAESLARILNKLRASALRLGTFHVPVIGRTPKLGQELGNLAVHDLVLRPLIANALECRVYGVGRHSQLGELLARIGERRGRVWYLDHRCELVRGYEPLWNATCEHHGIAIATRLSLDETQRVLDHCGSPEVWGSKYQLYQGTSRAAVSYCFEVAASSEAMAFLIPGSNGMEWMDVFADEARLPILWDQAMRKRLSGTSENQ